MTLDGLLARLRTNDPMASPPFELSSDRYRSLEVLERERALFAVPRIATLSSAIRPGGIVPYDEPGRSALLVRDPGGVLRAFTNSCRHRATRLVDAPCAAKAMVCPYHGWSYDLAGALLDAPHAHTFGTACEQRSLLPVAVAERDGLVWLGGDPEAHLGELAGDLRALDLSNHVIYRSSALTRRCNWKLVVEAFLDGYHIRVLHRDSVYRFFLDAMSVAEPVGPHIRALTARRTLRDASPDLRQLATPSYLVFPATVIIAHPDFVSIVTLVPLTPEVTEWRHAMAVPAGRAGETEHWDCSWALIEDGVFQREDFWACEQVQRGLTREPLLYGSLELPIGWFHAAIGARMA